MYILTNGLTTPEGSSVLKESNDNGLSNRHACADMTAVTKEFCSAVADTEKNLYAVLQKKREGGE